MRFAIALRVVSIMVLCMVPGYVLAKSKVIDKVSLPGFAAILLYVCQPCIIYYTFRDLELTRELVANFGKVFAFSFLIMAAILSAGYLLIKRWNGDSDMRIATVAMAFSNCSFFGVPVLEAVMPGNSAAIAYTSIYGVAMNILGWAGATTIITGNTKYFSLKKAVLNPVIIACAACALLLAFGIKLPSDVDDMICLAGRMSTPLSMMLLGARLASMDLKKVFLRKRQYVFTAVKHVLAPLLVLLLLNLMATDDTMRNTLFIIFCCPCASVVSNFAEMLGKGQEMAANLVVLGTMLSVITLPLMMMVGI